LVFSGQDPESREIFLNSVSFNSRLISVNGRVWNKVVEDCALVVCYVNDGEMNHRTVYFLLIERE
jgi:hypothetical protein